jgi:uncharacterized protein (TIGR02757 family)
MSKSIHKALRNEDLKDFLDEAVLKFNNKNFVEADPVSIPHLFTKKQDIEIAGFLAATIAWGNRKSILKNGAKLMELMDMSPHEFVINANKKDLLKFEKFVHRTFNGTDCIFFLESLKNIYKKHDSLEEIFILKGTENESEFLLKNRIINFRTAFLKTKHLSRSEKHISNPDTNSSAKRLCMYLRWMVRNDNKGVDFGIWKNIDPCELCLPLDVHTGNISRALGLLNRKQNDWKAVEEITLVLRTFDQKDPVKYDFALFGLGVAGFMKSF